MQEPQLGDTTEQNPDFAVEDRLHDGNYNKLLLISHIRGIMEPSGKDEVVASLIALYCSTKLIEIIIKNLF